MPRPYKRMMLVHDEGNIYRIAIEKCLRNTQPLCCIYAFSESSMDCQGSNKFSMCPLFGSVNGISIGGFHFYIANDSNRYL
jgi:hypothetical protein